MSKKKKMIIFIILLSVVLIVVNALIIWNKFFRKSSANEKTAVPTVPLESSVDYVENLSLHEDTISPQDDIDTAIYRITVSQKPLLSEQGLPDKGIAILESSLSDYFNDYDPDGGNYEAEVITDGMIIESVAPTFKVLVHMDDKDVVVTCDYCLTVPSYKFRSELDNQ